MNSVIYPASDPRPAATVLVVRDAFGGDPGGVEVLMVCRNASLAFGASAWVFPGGAVSAPDRDDAWFDHVEGDFDSAERAFRVAAVRETFEESGLLLARRASDGRPLTADEAASFDEHRGAVEKNPGLFLQLVSGSGLRLDLERLAPFAHWVTPTFEPKRYDTRFFLIAAPADQIARHDGCETTDHAWRRPSEILAQRERGEVKLMLPTRLNLEVLGASTTAADAELSARARPHVTVEPEIRERDGRRVLHIPSEAGYSLTEERLDRVSG